MSRINIQRTDIALPAGADLDSVRTFLFRCFDGFSKEDKAFWRRFWKKAIDADAGEMFSMELWFPRSGKFHRFHMIIEQRLFDSQDRIHNFGMFRDWLKIGAGWVTWVPGAKGGIVPLPKSTSYAKADEAEFHEFHALVIKFLRGGNAGKFMWPHLTDQQRSETMELILQEFEQ